MMPPLLSQLGQIFAAFINRMVEFFRAILESAATLKVMENAGELSENWQDFLAEAVGIKEEQVVDQKTREVVREIDPELVPFSVREEDGSDIGDSSTQFSIREDLSKVTEEQETQAMQDALQDVSKLSKFKQNNIRRAFQKQKQDIREQYEGTPMWRKAPNGKESNLTEDQWLTVRTPLFKQYYGDWETLSRINQVRSLQAFDAINTKPVTDKAEAKRVFQGFGDKVTNNIDGRQVRFPSEVAGKILRHKGFDSAAIVRVLDKVFERSIPAWGESEIVKEGHKPHKNIAGYHHYVGKVLHGEGTWFFRFTVTEMVKGKKGGGDSLVHSSFVSDVTLYEENNKKDASSSLPDHRTNPPAPYDEKLAQWLSSVNPKSVSKVIDKNGEPKPVYHGTRRPDRVGNVFKRSRATSGPMAFFTDDFEIGSSYAESKADTSVELPDSYSKWFKYKAKGRKNPVDIDQAWWDLSQSKRDEITKKAPDIGFEDPNGSWDRIILNPQDPLIGQQTFDFHLKEARGNALSALVEIWLNGGTLIRMEESFMQVLKAVGMDMSKVTFDSPHASFPAVYPVFLNIKNPFNTTDIPQEVVDVLEKESTHKRAKKPAGGNSDLWDKNTISGKEWFEALKEDLEKGTTHAWTRIPDWATNVLKAFGYDGIKDTGGKYSGVKHDVWIPFEESQVKSTMSNIGAFSQSQRIDFSIRSGDLSEAISDQVDRRKAPPSERVEHKEK